MDNELRVVIKQHTPMLHFQYEQFGTLRATEVKPKLDKYIWEQEWKGDYSKGKEYLTGYLGGELNLKQKFERGFRALNYQINITPTCKPTKRYILDDNKFPLYFGNMGNDNGDKELKHFTFCEDELIVSINSFQVNILKIIKKHIAPFFQKENFGTRQNKGFGAFKVETVNNEVPSFNLPSKYYFSLDSGEIGQENTYRNLFEDIEYFYKTLRSGINLKGSKDPNTKRPKDRLYFKSLLFQYAKKIGDEKFTWDKKKIRKELFGHLDSFKEIEADRKDPNGSVHFGKGREALLMRDLLGLSGQQQWKSYGNATVSKSHETIERFKSPLTFKPIYNKGTSWDIYIIPNQIPKAIKGEQFKIEAGSKDLNLTTPVDFDIEDYLKFAFSYFSEKGENISVEEYTGENEAHKLVELLENIYSQLSQKV